ncbi:MAG: hypothetical protein LBJ14_04345 [Desulfarculales bacterium]|jgi:hypothetical protein|nr:hypothetical protein [Desulfarculales bacterium]
MQVKARLISVIIFIIMLCSHALTANAQGLAVVVNAGAVMEEVWQGSTRGQELRAALQLTLGALPADIPWYMHWVNETPILFDRDNWPRLQPEPVLKGSGQGEKFTLALQQACSWLLENQGGSLLIISAGPLQFQAGVSRELAKNNLFCHALSLGLEDDGGIKALALQGGGGYLAVSNARRMLPFLNSSLANALAPGRLFIAVNSQDNTPLPMVLGLTRQNHNEKSRDVLSNRWLQLDLGGYGLEWPRDYSPLPRSETLPKRVSVLNDATILNVGGSGRIKLSSLDGNEVELNWPLALAEVNTGKLLVNKRYAPFSLDLPAGEYRAYTTANPHQDWRFQLAAGQVLEKIFGPPGSLLVTLTGPGRNQLNAAFTLAADGDSAGYRRGQTGRRIMADPGHYYLEVQIIPPLREEVEIKPQARIELNLPPAGILRVNRESAVIRGFEIRDSKDNRLLGMGKENREFILQPGAYRLCWPAGRKEMEVEILPGQVNIQTGP